MTDVLLVVAAVVLAAALAGLIRLVRGPTEADRMASVQLCGTSSIVILMIMALAFDAPRLLDVALVLSLLGAVAVFSLLVLPQSDEEDHRP